MNNLETLATLTYKTQNGDKLNERPIMNEQSRDIGNIDIQDTERRQTQRKANHE